MKYLSLILIGLFLSCKAQTVSLEQAAQCQINPNCPEFTYAKDINNLLSKYIGTWKGSYDGKVYELNFIKKEFYGGDVKDDLLVGRLKITNSSNQIIYNSFSEIDDNKTKLKGLYFASNLQSYMLFFSGAWTTGCINRGTVYLTMNTSELNKMGLMYLPQDDITNGECPNSFKSTLPIKQKIYLTKQ